MKQGKGPVFKISPPALDNIFKRKRLYRLLSGGSSRAVTWVCSPAGSGKTTLVADYLVQHKQFSLWYQIDQRDEDPATFFYYLAMAVKHATPRKRKPLPLFTREHLLGLNPFSLAYFEAVYERLNKPAVMVIDNYQILPEHSMLHQLIFNGLSVIPDGIRAVVISREPPPAIYSRMLANRALSTVEWPELRLTEDETSGIVRLQTGKPLPEPQIRQLYELTDGWMAGLVLMLTRMERRPEAHPPLQTMTLMEIESYFKQEVFEREPEDLRAFLQKAAFLPYMTAASAKELTGDSRAGEILMQLNRNHRFTEKRTGSSPSYQFHPLFRDFLLHQGEETFSTRELAGLRRKAAGLIEADGDIEEAAALYSKARDWEALSRIIIHHAFSLYGQGRYATLLAWLQNLPQQVIFENPWLSYWQGSAMLPYDPDGCQTHLERAFTGFRAMNKDHAMLLAWAETVSAIYYAMADYTPLDHWIEVLEQWLAEHPVFPSDTIEARVTATLFLALNTRQLDHPDIQLWADRAFALLTGPLEINLKVLLINNIILYDLYAGNLEKATEAMGMMDDPAVFSNVSTPMVTLISTIIKGNYFLLEGRHEACLSAIADGMGKLEAAGLRVLDVLVEGYGDWSLLTHGDEDSVREHLKQKAALYEGLRPFEQRLFLILSILTAVGSGDLVKAVQDARTLLNICQEIGAPFHIMMALLVNALVMHETGRSHEADELLERAMASAEASKAKLITFHALMLKSRFYLDHGNRSRGIVLLGQALSLGRSMGIYNHVLDTHAQVSRLFTLALEEGMEADYVRECIQRLNLKPQSPPVHIENWPWPVKIYTLGKFSLVLNGEEKKFPGRIKAKPLELLKALIACGGREVPEETLTDHLWPEADGDLAHTSFNTTLHRLRQLLCFEEALVLKSRKLTLNLNHCWVDVQAFDRLAIQAEKARVHDDLEGAARWSEKALDLYGGPFLPGDTQAPWSVSLREKMKFQFLSLLVATARALEEAGDYEKAVTLYQKGLDIDELLEPFYQGLMLCLKRSGRSMEAAAAYQRCRKTLAAVLGINPSRQTELIFRSL
jgi:ATP/maltotriose-dependent transcriptional regulator MalT/two-component SAPR family response regulator